MATDHESGPNHDEPDHGGLWAITYTITPDRGYFDRAEPILWTDDVYFETIEAMEFLEDGSVVVTYGVDGSGDALRTRLDDAPEKVISYAISDDSDALVAQLRFYPDETLERILGVQKSLGSSIAFPATYVGHDPATVELTETGPRDVLRERIEHTRAVATVDITQLSRYRAGPGTVVHSLTARQREVLRTAIELGYYETPRGATHEDIAAELECSKSVVGQHLRRIEQSLVEHVVSV